MKASIKRLLEGTRAEPLARKLKRFLERFGVLREKVSFEDVLTLRIMERVLEEDSNCVDIGCSRGAILLHILRFAPRGAHHVFEPIHELARELREKFPSVHVHEMALADWSGESTFQHVVSNQGYSGLRRRSYPTDHENVAVIHVQVARLDDLIPEKHQVHFIKIDVEGAEMLVLRGAERTIRRCRPWIVFEHGKGATEYYGTTSTELYEFLEDCGLQVSLLEGFLEGGPALDKEGFVAQFGGPQWYFVAHPGDASSGVSSWRP